MNSLTLPDMAAQTLDQQQPLDWVGMADIALPVRLHGQPIAARAAAGVSLDDGAARGIHMSRLYLALQALEQTELSPARQVLERFLSSHQGLSRSAYLDLQGQALYQRPAPDQPADRLEGLSLAPAQPPGWARVPRGTAPGNRLLLHLPVLGGPCPAIDKAATQPRYCRQKPRSCCY